ncbi:protein spaetzle 5-like isoform X2 [Limulus polyphemus]|uniref:Protein spaetzle 5-like isoform X2 n=1 Tax=Limulus polyphemus TaxID=6850 RepID=A0ABM1SER2_LIMPO|nr:protein spaetzle 5-like isoform X2 [Limulus polyphemus]
MDGFLLVAHSYPPQYSDGVSVPDNPPHRTRNLTDVEDNSRIVFPDDNLLEPSVDDTGVPLCAQKTKSTFCETVEDYPALRVYEAVNSLPGDVLQMLLEKLSSEVQGRTKFSADDLTDEPICTSMLNTFKPQVGENIKKKWLYIVNNVEVEQFVTSETCSEDGNPCRYVKDNLPFGYSSQCKQKYAYKNLLAIHPKKKSTFLDSFPFPSCCSCFIKLPPEFRRKKPETRVEDSGSGLS